MRDLHSPSVPPVAASLGRSYQPLSQDLNRVMNRIKCSVSRLEQRCWGRTEFQS